MGGFVDLRRGGWAQEVDAELHPGQGAVPQGLAATLYRNGAGGRLRNPLLRPAASRASTSMATIDGRLSALREGPTIDPRRSTTAHRNVHCATTGTPLSGVAFAYTAVARHDTERGEADAHSYGPVRTLPVPESLGFTFHGQWVHA
ncbi:hypothetical protein [Streptomyces anulatus]|uniref:hypothetical protein n=1 Tax=Streptomyces anulatus TaxID=1892 RepID=UPI0033FAA96F